MNRVERWAVAILTVVFVVVAAIMVFAYFSGSAKAHEWYDKQCCSDRDCSPIKTWTKYKQGGWTVTTEKGMTAHVPEDWLFLPNDVRNKYGWIKKESKDTKSHACISYEQPEDPMGYLNCLYITGGT